MSLEIRRLINGQIHTITLTEEELEQAYRIKERRYLDEDFANGQIQHRTRIPDSIPVIWRNFRSLRTGSVSASTTFMTPI